jgi:hypothetical protein
MPYFELRGPLEYAGSVIKSGEVNNFGQAEGQGRFRRISVICCVF